MSILGERVVLHLEVLDSIKGTYLEDLFQGELTDVFGIAGGALLAAIDGATTMQPSAGGGGGNNDLPKKKDDEDWLAFARRTIAFGHKTKSIPKGMSR